MSVKTNTAPELTQEQVQKVLVQPLQAASLFLAQGPRIFDTSGPLRLPKGRPVDGSDLGWTGESEEIPQVDAKFDELHLMPSTMKSVKVITRYSNELARQSVIALDQAIKDRLVADVAAKLDSQFLSATGDGVTSPKGLFAWDGVTKVTTAVEFTFDDFLDAWGAAMAANANVTSMRWLVRSEDFVKLRKLKDSGGKYLLNADPTADAVFRLFGCQVVISNRVPVGKAALVDFAQVAVARDLAPSVTILKERFADFDEQALRVVSRYDVAPLNPESVVVLTKAAK